MNRFNDLQELWQGTAPTPRRSPAELISLVKAKRRKVLLGMAAKLAALVLTLPLMVWIFIGYHPVYVTTRISIVMITLLIIAAVAVQGRSLGALTAPLKDDVDNRTMIAAMRRFQARQKFINTTFISGYFILLGAAMGLYLFEFVRGNVAFAVVAYTLTFGWMGFAWLYLRPRSIRKQNAAIDEIMAHLKHLEEEWEG